MRSTTAESFNFRISIIRGRSKHLERTKITGKDVNFLKAAECAQSVSLIFIIVQNKCATFFAMQDGFEHGWY